MDVMLYTGQLTLGDLVITSVFGEDIEYRIAVGTHHGSQIVLEKTGKAVPSLTDEKDALIEGPVDRQESCEYSQKSKLDKAHSKEQCCCQRCQHGDAYQEEVASVNYTDGDEMIQYVEEESVQIEYHNGMFVEYGTDGAPETLKRERVVRLLDEGRQHLVQYTNEEGVHCEGYVQFIDDENGRQVMGLIDATCTIVFQFRTRHVDEQSHITGEQHGEGVKFLVLVWKYSISLGETEACVRLPFNNTGEHCIIDP
ncbi:hypothetical protein GCK32_007102 [Trichostrongylus colubriformis]|uniref:Uncharacterized protein n=1 Tax=Trichostrongylus colubriformis TaxID=6319 RepID=A0AAN8F2N2_TRICO